MPLLNGDKRIIPIYPPHTRGFGIIAGKHGWRLFGKLYDFAGCDKDHDGPNDHFRWEECE